MGVQIPKQYSIMRPDATRLLQQQVPPSTSSAVGNVCRKTYLTRLLWVKSDQNEYPRGLEQCPPKPCADKTADRATMEGPWHPWGTGACPCSWGWAMGDWLPCM